MVTEKENLISIDPEILGGTPVFRGTRVAIQTLFDYLENSTLEEFLEGFPSVSRKQAEAVIALASEVLTSFLSRHEDFAG
jgi:uncharacterized protein (DUF433 family)